MVHGGYICSEWDYKPTKIGGGLVLGAEVRRRGLQPPDRWDASGALRSSQGA